jgi:N-acyl-D-aspartate/D-glutamate deacylase
MSGEHFNPHVSTAVASRGDLDQLVAEPFTALDFSPAGAAVHHVGPVGTAARMLEAWCATC